jgi:hypothetical protein
VTITTFQAKTRDYGWSDVTISLACRHKPLGRESEGESKSSE